MLGKRDTAGLDFGTAAAGGAVVSLPLALLGRVSVGEERFRRGGESESERLLLSLVLSLPRSLPLSVASLEFPGSSDGTERRSMAEASAAACH